MPVSSSAEWLESARALDKPADTLADALRRLLPKGKVRDLLAGTPLGHPLHPLLITLPIGAWTSASVLDLAGGRGGRVPARRLVATGLLGAVPTAAAGAVDWIDTSGAERRVGLAHLLSNSAALALYGASWAARRKGRQARGVALGLAGGAAMAVGSYLGGHLAYACGVGVDTTAFEAGPREWTLVGDLAGLRDGKPRRIDVDGVPLLVVADSEDPAHLPRVLADRCTHRGGPLHEGEIVDGCVPCPWHGSQFRLADGKVRRGPATRPQPVYETRVLDGVLEIRRAEARALRANPVAAG